MSWPSVRFGCAALKYTAAVREWSPALSSGLSEPAIAWSVPLMTVRLSLNGASGCRILESSQFLPSPLGVQYPGLAPCGTCRKL